MNLRQASATPSGRGDACARITIGALMGDADDYLRQLLGQAAAEAAYLEGLGRAEADRPGAPTPSAAAPVAVSLMITRQQRAALRERGFSDEDIRTMTPAEAHRHLAL